MSRTNEKINEKNNTGNNINNNNNSNNSNDRKKNNAVKHMHMVVVIADDIWIPPPLTINIISA